MAKTPNASTPTPDNPNWYGSIAHTEFGSRDPDATMDFLSRVFGARFETTQGPMEYHMAYTPGQPSLAVRQVMQEHEPGPSQTPYFTVPDVDAALDEAVRAGAKVLLPKTDIGGGFMAWMEIPGGLTIAMMQPPGQ